MSTHRAHKRRGKRAPAAARRRPQAVDRLDLVTRAINEGVYDWDIATGKVDYSERVRNAVGLTREQLGTAADWHRRIHPEDRPRYDAALVEHFKGRTERFECDYRYRAGDGCWRWARQHGVAQRDARGRAVRMIGSTGDITELKQAAEALKASDERYALATRAATEGIYEWNVQTGSLYLSDRAKAVFAIAGEALTAAAWNARVHGEDFPAYRDAIRAYFKGDTAQFEYEYRIRNAAGSYAWVLDRGIARRDAGGRVTHMLGALTDITQRKLGEIELRRARDATEEALEQQTATAEILHVISSSSTDTQPVFEAIVDACRRLFPDCHVGINLVDDAGGLYLSAVRGANPELKRYFEEAETRRSGTQVRLSGRVAHYPDIEAADVPGEVRRGCRAGGVRSIIFAPLVLNDKGIGSLWVARLSAGSFADREIALLKTFASQAVIAIENVRLFNETNEALERQTATSEILRTIANSPTDVQPLFEAIIRNAVQLCDGAFGLLLRYDGQLAHVAVHHNFTPETEALYWRAYPQPLSQENPTTRAMLERSVTNVADIRDTNHSAGAKERAGSIGYRALLSVPMMRDETPIGAIAVARSSPGAFRDSDIALLQTFADQAVIAIENVRLFNETKEALEQQTAIGELLRVISNSPTDVRPVLQAVAERATRICEASDARIFLVDGDRLRHAAGFGDIPVWTDTFPLNRGSATGRAVIDRTSVSIADVELVSPEDFPVSRQVAGQTGWRSILAVPLMREDRALGAIILHRREVRPFAEKQGRLLKTFADQASIAIENVRLFNETKEALERETATSEVLRVISASPTHVQPVLDTIAERAASLCAAKIGFVTRFDGKFLHMVAVHGASAEALETMRALYPIDPEAGGSVAARVIRSGAAVQIADVFADDSYAHKEAAQAAGYRSAMGVPLMRKGQIVGAIIVVRSGAGEFAPKQVELLKIFADQAVIAIENARLFRAIQEKSAQLQVATKHKSDFLASMSHELRTPLNAIIGFTRIVQRNAVGRLEPRQLENLEKIQASGEHLLALINAVLDLSKVEAGRVEVSAREVEIAPVLEHCLRTVEPLVEADAVSLDREFDGRLPTMFVDDEKLRQIVINLLSNAAKFTARGSIRLGAHADGDAVTIAVTDTGIGIAADKLDVIFEEFRQADTDSTRARSGTGLGLAIARRLARLMGGDIDAASEPGLGSTFTLTLPLRYSA